MFLLVYFFKKFFSKKKKERFLLTGLFWMSGGIIFKKETNFIKTWILWLHLRRA